MGTRMRLMPLTSDDQAIFGRLPIGSEFEARCADTFDFLLTSARLRYLGSIVHAVAMDEYAHRSVEMGRPA